MTKAYTLLSALKTRLSAITVANGYTTNAGASVVLGPVPRMPGEALPFVRLTEIDAAAENATPHRPTALVRVQFVAEAFGHRDLDANVMSFGHDLVGDLKKALFGDPTRDVGGLAIEARLEGYRIIPPEDGSDILVAQVRGSFSFHDTFTSP